MIDLAQVSLALRNCTARSLVLLDEFGKGTLSTGSSLIFLLYCSFCPFSFYSVTYAAGIAPFHELCHYNFTYFNVQPNLENLPGRFIDGAGLSCGVLRHLLNRGSACPKVLVATHFHDVFQEGIIDPENVPVSFCHMQAMFTSGAGTIMEPNTCDHAAASCTSPGATSVEDDVTGTIGPTEKITYLYR